MLGTLSVPGRPNTLEKKVGQWPTAPLWEAARYRLRYCLKGVLNPSQPPNFPEKVSIQQINKAENYILNKTE